MDLLDRLRRLPGWSRQPSRTALAGRLATGLWPGYGRVTAEIWSNFCGNYSKDYWFYA